MAKPVCVVIGIGPKNGRSFARRFAEEGYSVALLSRSTEYSARLAEELGDARAYVCDASDSDSIESAFAAVRADFGPVEVLIFNAGSGSWGNIEDLTAEDFESGWRVNALGGFVSSKQVLPGMLERGAGTIIFVGATASLRGRPFTTGFAPAKAAQRSLAQAMARHLGPRGIHVALMILDGSIGPNEGEEIRTLEPDAIADSAVYLTRQDRSAWSFELELRPHGENW